eukprot:m.136375 g.136375  ORF g.136375 m.136375 type:complete len:1220 (-) comp10645_c0_seq1:382-4041(-)
MMSGKKDNRRGTTTSNKSSSGKTKKGTIKCHVWHLDNKGMTVELDKNATGNDLFHTFLAKLDPIGEEGYFGLYFPYTDPVEWVTDDLIKKQADIRKPVEVEFGVKFYPANPSKIVSPHTKYLLYLQLKEHLATGRFVCHERDAIQLCALSLQADLGDFNEEVHRPGYLAEFMLLPNQERVEEDITKWHRALEKMTFTEAIQTFLSLSAKQELYGVNLFPVKEDAQKLFLGVHSRGITLYGEKLKVVHKHKWSAIKELLFEKDKFILCIKPQLRTQSLVRTELTCTSSEHARALWADAVQKHTFFRRTTQPKVQVRSKLARFMSAKSQFPLKKARVNVSGKTEFETREDAMRSSTAKSLTFAKAGSLKRSVQENLQRSAYKNVLSETQDVLYKHTPAVRQSEPLSPERIFTKSGGDRQKLVEQADTFVSLSKQPTTMDSSRLQSFHSEDMQLVDTSKSVVVQVVTIDIEPARQATFVDVSDLEPLAVDDNLPLPPPPVDEIEELDGKLDESIGMVEDESNNILSPFQTPQRQGTVENLEPDFVEGMAYDKQRSQALLMTATPLDRKRKNFAPLSPISSPSEAPPRHPKNAFLDSNNGSFISMNNTDANKEYDASKLAGNMLEDVHGNEFNAIPDPDVDARTVRGFESIEFPKKDGKLGFSIGTSEQNPIEKLYVRSVIKDGAADDDGRLQVGDELEAINDEIVSDVPLNSAIGIINNRGDAVKLLVSRECVYTTLVPKNGAYGLGFRGGKDLGFPIIISKIAPNSAADENETIKIGREITHVNKISLEHATHDDVLALIKASDPEKGMDLVIHPTNKKKRGSSKKVVSQKVAVGPAPTPSNPVETVEEVNGHANGISQEEEILVRLVDEPLKEELHTVADVNDVDVAEVIENGVVNVEGDGSIEIPTDFGDDGDGPSNTSNYQRRDSFVLEQGKYFDRANTVLKRKLIKGSYQTIPKGRLEDPMFSGCHIARLPENKERNRYRDILPFDDTRVVMQEEENDYFNGNYINFEAGGKKYNYIACQGPKPETSSHFWRVVWENSVRIIVMVTNLKESGRVKCHKYWPDHVKQPQQYGDFSVTINAELPRTGFVIRDFNIRYKESKRRMFQFQFIGWPDHGIPKDGDNFLEFMREVEAFKCRLKQPMPLLVHCSAGVGRSGVFILTELGLALLRANQPVNMSQILIELRRQRPILVQTPSQFDFVHDTLKSVQEKNGPDFVISP